MKCTKNIGLANVQEVYTGPEGDLWELIMGEQIHIGGLVSSMDLAERAGIAPGSRGVDFCCCTGAGMRFLIRFRQVAEMTGVDATPHVVQRGIQRCRDAGMADRIRFVLADACSSGLPSASADFAWAEDAWCYVVDKPRLICEAARVVRPGGTVAFTDWVEGPAGLTDAEADRLLQFMKFPAILDIDHYAALLQEAGCSVLVAEDTKRFPIYVDLYLNMLNLQLTYDALRIIGFDTALMQALSGEMRFMRELAHARKIAQGVFVARKTG